MLATLNANPGLASLVGAAIGAGVSAFAAVRKSWKKEAREEARKVARVMLADHVAGCAWRPALTPTPGAVLAARKGSP